MNFLIIGDSWGLGEYTIQQNLMTLVPNSGLDYYLTAQGHTTKNLSAGSAANFGQLRHCRTVLESSNDQTSFDYIIWLHTEPIRDASDTVFDDPIDGPQQFPEFFQIKSFDQAMEYINRQNYAFAQTIYDKFGIPFIVIGGLGRVHSSIGNFTFAKHVITSWAEEMLNCNNLPDNDISRDRDKQLIPQLKFDRATIIDAIEQSQYYRELLQNSPKFPDNAHPATGEYRQLAQRIIELVT